MASSAGGRQFPRLTWSGAGEFLAGVRRWLAVWRARRAVVIIQLSQVATKMRWARPNEAVPRTGMRKKPAHAATDQTRVGIANAVQRS